MIRIVLVDDHAVVRSGLRQLLASNDDLDVIGEAGNGADAVDVVTATTPDVVLMDLSMPEVDGVEATRRIHAAHPGVAVVVLTSFSERDRILAALDAGAVGYLLKDAEPDEIRRAVRAAAAGESPLSPKAARTLLESRGAIGGAPSPPPVPATPELRESAPAADLLSAREREVLAAVVGGMANKQIARELGISEKTVKAHLTNVFGRIGVTDRTQAALWAREHGIA